MQEETTSSPITNSRIAIAGAGMSGLCMAVELLRAGFKSVVIFEKSDCVGGVWAQNTYPNAGCDVPSFLYSFSFAPKADWSHKYARQPEILEYFRDVTREFAVDRKIRFNTCIDKAIFDEQSATWEIVTSDGKTETFDFFISAVGQLNRSSTPDFPGRKKFRGAQFHSAHWDHTIDMRDKRVAVIGNGASAVQFVPELVSKTRQLILFQRSPNWISRLDNYRYPRWVQRMFERLPWTARLHRLWIYLVCEARWLAFRRGGTASWLMTHWFRWRLRRKLSEPLLSIMTPDYVAGCKRVLLSSDYYRAIQQPNVTVVTDRILRFKPQGIVTKRKTYDVDVTIFATGFKASELLVPMEVIGRDRKHLSEQWRRNPGAYLGMLNPGFPNFFMLYGPNTNLGHNSVIFMVQCQVRYIIQCLQKLSRENGRSIEVNAEATARFSEMVQRRLALTVWNDDCTSWYKTANGVMLNNWCASTLEYWYRTRRPINRDLRVLTKERHIQK